MDKVKVGSVEGENEVRFLLERENSERRRHMAFSIVAGAIAGLLIGIAQLMVIGSRQLWNWPFMPMIPLFSALGWALFGMIIGGSGVFAKLSRKTAETGENQSCSLNSGGVHAQSSGGFLIHWKR